MVKKFKIVHKKNIKILVRACFFITHIKYLKVHRYQGSLFVCKIKRATFNVAHSVTRSPIELFWTAKNEIYEWGTLCVFRQ